jgi:hypothetical protein
MRQEPENIYQYLIRKITGNKISKKIDIPLSECLSPTKHIVLFDIDDTILCRREIYGQYNLHNMRVQAGLAKENDQWMATIEDIIPRPNFFFNDGYGPLFIYLRPNIKETLNYAKENADAIYAFSASSDPSYILEQTGLDKYFDGIYGREFTTNHYDKGKNILRKDLAAIRNHLKLKDYDELYMLDDHPEWIDASGPHDHILSVKPFQPPYKLYGVQVMKYQEQTDPAEDIPDDISLLTILQKIFSK